MAARRARKQFLLCIRNDGCDDLEPAKLYEKLPDRTATKEGYVRIVDDSGEDYLYPATYFAAVKLPREAQRVLRRRELAHRPAVARRR